jgi:RNA polymerase sigma-70 factor (TIGR02960 family)
MDHRPRPETGTIVSRIDTPPGPPGDDALVAAAMGGDESAFGVLVQRHRRELHVHCYRMLGSFEEAEDLVQETFLRAWRRRDTFEEAGPSGRGSGKVSGFRAWLYRIATNASLDAIRRNARRVPVKHSFAEVPWLTPYPDRLLDEVAAGDAEPGDVVVDRETIELTFLAAMQVLPPKQRAALIVRDVLGWSANETASLLDTSVAAANSALQRARATMQEQLPRRRLDWSTSGPSEEERALLARFIDAHERGDAAASVALAHEDIRITMPPAPLLFEGRAGMLPLLERAFGAESPGQWRLLPTSANRMPAAASYLKEPGDDTFRAFKLDVLRVEDGHIREITTFGWSTFPALALPLTL